MKVTALQGQRFQHRAAARGVGVAGVLGKCLCFIAVAVFCVLGSQASVALAGGLKNFNIEQQSLSSALNEFARQSDRQILFSTAVANAKRTRGIKGDLEPEEAKHIPTVCHSLDMACEALDKDREFLTRGGVFTNDLIDAYIGLKMQEVTRLRMSTHPVELELYYSC